MPPGARCSNWSPGTPTSSTWRCSSGWTQRTAGAFLGQVDGACRAAAVASDLSCAGTRVELRQLNPTDRARLARAVRAFTPYMSDMLSGHSGTVLPSSRIFSPLQSLGPVGYVESSDVPRAES
jgi:hypothetical protein